MCAKTKSTPKGKPTETGSPVLLSTTMTVRTLMEFYLDLIQSVADSTKTQYRYYKNIVARYPIAQMRICDVKKTDAKVLVQQLVSAKIANSTIRCIRSFLMRCFMLPTDDEIIPRNPFDFRLSLPRSKPKSAWLDAHQQSSVRECIDSEPCLIKYSSMYKVIEGTGMRLGEFSGLTLSSINFDKNCIRIDHQLLRSSDGTLHVCPPKTSSGYREIPMLPGVAESLRDIIANRPRPDVEPEIDGYSGFLFLDSKGSPLPPSHFQYIFRKIQKVYNRTHATPLPKFSPHVLRHTFGANLAALSLHPVIIQKLMGHAHPSTAINNYSHISYDMLVKAINRALNNNADCAS